MTDQECVQLLQWALPRLRLRWAGFRKVRKQVCRRINQRLKELGLPEVREYQSYLDAHPEEWPVLDGLCRISISRFYRDKQVFQYLEREVLYELAQMAVANGEHDLRYWSIGCASGEEPYTLAILWQLCLAPRVPTLGCRILATDVDQRMIERARRGCYPPSSVKDIPEDFLAQAFLRTAEGFCVKAPFREPVTFLEQDIRTTVPDGQFHLILCRNVVFTYFDDELQRQTLHLITERLVPRGALVIGSLEFIPEGGSGLEPWSKKSGVYRKSLEA